MSNRRQSAVGSRQSGARAASPRGAILLELLLAFAILAGGILLIMSQFSSGLDNAHTSEIRMRCVQLAEVKLAELDAGLINADSATSGDFGPAYAGFSWIMTSRPFTLIPNLPQTQTIYDVTLAVSYANGPDNESFEVNTIRPGPYIFDLTTDVGLEQQQIEALSSNLPLPSLQQGQLDLAELSSLDPTVLMTMLPQIMEALGGQGLPADLQNAVQGGNTDQIQQALDGLGGDIPPDVQQRLQGGQ